MTSGMEWDRAWASLFARGVLGLMFLMAGIHKVFQMGAGEHARKLFVEPYRETFLPVWTLWLTGTAVPYIELLAGGLLLVGLFTRPALIAVGAVLLLVTFGHLLAEPLFAFHRHVMPRLALLLFLLLMPAAQDRFSLPSLLGRLARSGG